MGRAHRQHLEQRAHAGRRNEALGGGLDGAGTLGVGGHQPRRALGDAESAQKLGLGDGTIRGEARSPCLVGEGRELDVGGQVGGAWRGERVDVGVPAHGLQRVAIGGLGRAVVDEERDAGPCAPGQLGEHLVLAGPQLEDGAGRRCWRCSSMSRLVPDRETQRTLRHRARRHARASRPSPNTSCRIGSASRNSLAMTMAGAVRHLRATAASCHRAIGVAVTPPALLGTGLR